MMNQYKDETAQIHAPAALIEKTKAAVREEERRIRGAQDEKVQTSVSQVSYADYAAYQRKRSLRRWTYPLTAAAAVVLLVSVSMAMRGVRSGDSTAMDMEMAAAEEMTTEGDACAEMPEEMNGGTVGGAVSGGMESAGDVTADSAAVSEEAESSESAVAEAPAADPAEENIQSNKKQESSTKESERAEKEDWVQEDSAADTTGDDTKDEVREFRSAKDAAVQIEAVEERPDFYDDAAAEDIIYEGQIFRVLKRKRGWAAYVETEAGEAYVIQGRMEDQESFLQEAHAGLMELTGSR